ncbi:MAG: UspA [Devosia sp.]|nr:UspA [Devosia sp.]
MLTDVFVPLFTFPDETEASTLPKLARFLEAFATQVTYCGIVANVPETGVHWGSRLVSLSQMVAEVEQRSRSAASRLLEAAQQQTSSFSVERSTITAPFGYPGQTVASRAQNYDVTAVLLPPGNVEIRAIAEDIMFGSGRPLITIPEAAEFSANLGCIAVAWDGSPTAARAVYDAMPLLVEADTVVIVNVADEKPLPNGTTERLDAYLRRHDIAPQKVDVNLGSRQIGAALQHAAAEHGAGLLVMGAYGHSRLREFVLGGATAGVLNEPAIPILFSR